MWSMPDHIEWMTRHWSLPFDGPEEVASLHSFQLVWSPFHYISQELICARRGEGENLPLLLATTYSCVCAECLNHTLWREGVIITLYSVCSIHLHLSQHSPSHTNFQSITTIISPTDSLSKCTPRPSMMQTCAPLVSNDYEASNRYVKKLLSSSSSSWSLPFSSSLFLPFWGSSHD